MPPGSTDPGRAPPPRARAHHRRGGRPAVPKRRKLRPGFDDPLRLLDVQPGADVDDVHAAADGRLQVGITVVVGVVDVDVQQPGRLDQRDLLR